MTCRDAGIADSDALHRQILKTAGIGFTVFSMAKYKFQPIFKTGDLF